MHEATEPIPPGVRDFVDAWNRRTVDEVLHLYCEDAVVRFVGGFEQLIGREFVGRDAIGALFYEWADTFDSEVEVERAQQVGDRLLLVQRHTTRGRSGGVETTMRYGTVVAFRDGLISETDNYYEVDDAYAAVGLTAPKRQK